MSDIDLKKAGIEEMFEAIPRRGRGATLWWFQFGPYTGTNVFVWGGHLEDGLEIAAGWLAENAPGHIVDQDIVMGLIREALEEKGKTWAQWNKAMAAGDEWAYGVEQEALADLTYTEAGYITSYEWWVNELHPGDELYAEVWEATIDELAETDIDEDDIEAANEFAEKLDLNVEWA
jgi:hypothetical protein